MNFFKHHIGDYASATDHLSWDEDMAYTRLMRVYYRDEKPLPADLQKVYRLARAQSRTQRAAIDTVLAEFFTPLKDGWHNKRCDEEVTQAQAQADINRKIAANRPRSANGSSNGSHHEPSTNRPPLQTPDSSLHPDPEIPTQTLPENREGPVLENGPSNPRALGTNPRAKGTNPRAQGTNPRADRDERRSDRDAALAVWNRLVASGGAEPKRDAKLQAAIDAAGGWSRIAQREQGIDAQRVQRDFVEAYRSAAT